MSEDRYECKECGKVFNSEKALRIHTLKHKKEREVLIPEMPEYVEPSPVVEPPLMTEKPKRSILSFLKRKTKTDVQKELLKELPDIFKGLPKWAIKEKLPMFMKRKDKEQMRLFVGVSRTAPPVQCWVKFDDMLGLIYVGEKAYKHPHAVHGQYIFYDIDRMTPLIDNSSPDDNFNDSLHVAQVKNMAYTLGKIAGAKDLLKNLGLILIVNLAVGLICLAILALTYQNGEMLKGALDTVTTYIKTHP